MIATRSPAARHALLLCLGVGVLAVGLAISLHGRASSIRIWVFADLGSREFWIAAMILGLDAVLVLAGGRGSRAVATFATGILFVLLVLAIGFGILTPLSIMNWLLFAKGWRSLMGGLLGFGCIGGVVVVQWLSFIAVAESDHFRG
jgi:hypothetical protein